MITFKTTLAAAALAAVVLFPGAASASVVALDEGFGNVGSLPGWSQLNHSFPAGTGWFQGNPGVFGAQAGPANAYAAANYLGAADGLGVVDNWLITPVLSLSGLTSLSFWTRHEAEGGFADYLEVRFASGSATETSSFTTLLGTIGGAAGYPADWSVFSSGLNVEGEGRFAFRYVGLADTLNYVGLDTVRIVTAVPEPATCALFALGLGALGFLRRKSSI